MPSSHRRGTEEVSSEAMDETRRKARALKRTARELTGSSKKSSRRSILRCGSSRSLLNSGLLTDNNLEELCACFQALAFCQQLFCPRGYRPSFCFSNCTRALRTIVPSPHSSPATTRFSWAPTGMPNNGPRQLEKQKDGR